MQRSQWRTKFKRWNLYGGLAGHSLLTMAVVALVVVMWVRGSGGGAERERITDDRAVAILRNLKAELTKDDAAGRMQSFFPEGACFLYTLYGLSWANLADDGALKSEATTEIKRALEGQKSPTTLQPFWWDTTVHRGAFWLGQRNLLLAKYLQLEPLGDDDLTTLTDEVHANAKDLHTGFMTAPHHVVDSYDGMCWPADHPAGLVSLSIHDDMFGTTYSEALIMWKEQFLANGWKETVLPPGRIDSKTGYAIEPARGCANSLMIAILAEADPEFAAKLYRDYQEHFQIARCGFSMFREYPADATGFVADVDSGPIIMDAGVTATGVGLAAARAVGDADTERDIRDLSEMFGFPQMRKGHGGDGEDEGTETLRYLWSVIPIGDAFLAWGWSIPRAQPPLGDFLPVPAKRWVFHGIVILTLLILLGQWAGMLWLGRRRLRRLHAAEQ
jgi:hypothetical protein